MKNELTLKSETQLAPELSDVDILSIYKVPASIDKMVEKNKTDLLNKLNCGAVLIDAFAEIGNSTDFMVDIPAGLRNMLKSGKAVFDNSAKSPGNFTPNIRIVGKNGIQGQATIYEGTNPQSVTNGLANIAMMAMVQSVLAKMEIIDEKLDSIVQGQKNDRVGKIIGSFKTFMDLYPTFQSDEEMRNSANQTYQNMQIGLAQIHLDIDEKRKALESAPTNHWKSFWNSIRHPSRNDAERYQNYYTEFIYDMQLYNRLILLTDIVLRLIISSCKRHKVFTYV